MAWGAALTILSKVTYSIAIFASRIIAKRVAHDMDAWVVLLFLIAFFFIRWMIDWSFRHIKAVTVNGKLARAIFLEFLNTNWTSGTFVLVQRVVKLFTDAGRVVRDPVVLFVLINSPLLLALVSGKVYSVAKFTNTQIAEAVEEMLGKMTYSLAYFAADAVSEAIEYSVTAWSWLIHLVVLVVLNAVVVFLFAQWRTEDLVTRAKAELALVEKSSSDAEAGAWVFGDTAKRDTEAMRLAVVRAEQAVRVKAIFQEDWSLIALVFILVLMDLYLDMVAQRWHGAQNTLVAAVWLLLVLMLGLALVIYLSDFKKSQFTKTPLKIFDQAVFAMALFLAGQVSATATLTHEWSVFLTFVIVLLVDGLLSFCFAFWKPKKDTAEEKVKVFYVKASGTWMTLALSYSVRLVVDQFAKVWEIDTDGDQFGAALVATIECEVALLLIIATVFLVTQKMTTEQLPGM